MNPSQIYIAISMMVLVIIFILMYFVSSNKKEKKFTPLTGLASGFILVGITISSNRLIAYSLMIVGVILAIIDMVLKVTSRD